MRTRDVVPPKGLLYHQSRHLSGVAFIWIHPLTPVVLTEGWWSEWVEWCDPFRPLSDRYSGAPVKGAQATVWPLVWHRPSALIQRQGLLHHLLGDYLEKGIPFEKWGGVGPSAFDTVMMFTHQDGVNVATAPPRYDTSQILCLMITVGDLLCLAAVFGDI